MEVNQKLNVGAKEFFDALAVSVAYDVSRTVGKKVNPSQLYPGYRYQKKMKNKVRQEGDVDVVIKQFSSPDCYEARFKSSQGTNFILYKIEDMKDGNVMIHYSEGFEGKNTFRALNHKLISWLYLRGARKRISRMLLSMESYIKEQREN